MAPLPCTTWPVSKRLSRLCWFAHSNRHQERKKEVFVEHTIVNDSLQLNIRIHENFIVRIYKHSRCNVMSSLLVTQMTNMSLSRAPYDIKSYSLSHSWTLWWWWVRWLEQWRLQVATELQQRCRKTNRRWKSIPRSSSSHREGSITERGASCGQYNHRRRWNNPKTLTWTYVGGQMGCLSEVRSAPCQWPFIVIEPWRPSSYSLLKIIQTHE